MSELKIVMKEHKKCPCCDSEDISVGSKYVSIGEDIYIRCNTCGLKMQLCKEYGWKELLKRWNTRKPMQNIVERLEEEYHEIDKSKKESYENGDWERFDMFTNLNRGIYKAIAIVNTIVKEEGEING